MPLYDFECKSCNTTTEKITHWSENAVVCPKCHGIAFRIISIHGQNCTNEDAPWIRSVLEVVDKDSDKVHTKRFLAEPTRENYRAWMKAEKIRHLEPGEKSVRASLDLKRHTDKVMEMRRNRHRIELRG
jgi:putative FmdB family regulatory protein